MKAIVAASALLWAAGANAQTAGSAAEQAAVEAAAAAVEAAASDAAEWMFDPSRDAMADVDAALAAARVSGRHVLVVFGGDWCHDSTALAAAMTQPRTAAMLAARYEIVRVHVPYSRSERVIPAAQRFGIAEVDGTPTVLILRPDGTPTNLEDAPRWRNAASRKQTAIHRALERAAPAIGG